MNIDFGKKMPSDAFALGHRILVWWFRELVSLIPTRWQRKEAPRIEARQDGDDIILAYKAPRVVAEEAKLHKGIITPASFLPAAPGVRRGQLPVWLFPSGENILSRRVQIPASAASRFQNLLSLEMDRWSPYKLEEVYVTWKALASEHTSRREIDLRVVPRTLIDGLRRELDAAGIDASYLALGSTKEHVLELRRATGSRTNVVSVILLMVLGVAAMAIDWFAAGHEREIWRGRFAAEMRLFASQRNLEERISRAVASVSQSDGSFSKGKMLADLSSTLPDTDWLTEIIFKNENLTIRGYALNIDQLIKALEPLAADRIINLQGEVALDSGINRQRFSVVFRPHGA